MTAGRLAFAAHDIAGGEILLRLLQCSRRQGYDVGLLAAGPAAALWTAAGEHPFPGLTGGLTGGVEEAAAVLSTLRPELIVTGASYHADFERSIWRAARGLGIRSLAMIDAWINFPARLTCADGTRVDPDALGVIDDRSAGCFERDLGFGGPIHVVGQAHLAALARDLRPFRERRSLTERKRIVFFTEPISQYQTGDEHPGYDQFSTVAALVEVIAGLSGVELVVKVHPKDVPDDWAHWHADLGRTAPRLAAACRLAVDGVADLLVAADLVVGMTTMVLVQAVLLDAPALSRQIERRRNVNPILDSLPGLTVVTDPVGVAAAVVRLLRAPGSGAPQAVTLFRSLEGSDERAASAIAQELAEARRLASYSSKS